MGREPIGADVLTAVPSIEFDEAWARRAEEIIDPEGGLKVNFISRREAKRASGRSQDLADIKAIEKALKSRL